MSLASLVNKGTLTPRIQWDMSEDHFELCAEYASHSALLRSCAYYCPILENCWKLPCRTITKIAA